MRPARWAKGRDVERSRAKTGIGRVSVAVLLLATSACSDASSGGRDYDISPVFPLSAGKCARYNGVEEGEGLTSRCMVTKTDCERAASDWRDAMQSSGVRDAINFTCR